MNFLALVNKLRSHTFTLCQNYPDQDPYRDDFKNDPSWVEYSHKIFHSKKKGYFLSRLYPAHFTGRVLNNNAIYESEEHYHKNPHFIGYFHTHPTNDYVPSVLDLYNHILWNCKLMFIGTKSHLAYYKFEDFTTAYDELFDQKHALHLVIVPTLYSPQKPKEGLKNG